MAMTQTTITTSPERTGTARATGAQTRARFVLALAGVTAYWPLLRRNALFYSLAGHDATEALAVGWYGAFLLFVVAFVLGSRALERRSAVASHPTSGAASGTRTPSRAVPAVVAAFVAQLACKLVETLTAPTGVAGAVVALLDTCLYALVFVLLTYAWAAWLVGLDARTASLSAIGTFGASFALKNVALLPGALGVVVTAAMPLLSCALWLIACRDDAARGPRQQAAGRLGSAGDDRAPDMVGAPDAHDADDASARGDGDAAVRLSPHARGVVLTLATFLVVGGFVRGLVNGTVSGSVQFPPLAMDLVSVTFACLAFVYRWREGRRGRASRMARTAWSVVAIVFFAGLLFMPILGTQQFGAGAQAVIQARTYFELLLWLFLVGIVRERGATLAQAFGLLFILVDTVSGFIGYVLPHVVARAFGLPGVEMTSTMALLVTLLLIVACLLILNPPTEASTPGASEGGEEANRGSRQPPCLDGADVATRRPAEGLASDPFATLARERDLTAREERVARLIAAGNTQRRAAELEGISISTVQTHVKSIYRKLGIHSRQELIDLAHAPATSGPDGWR